MAIKEICTYDDNGLISVEQIEIPDIEFDVQDMIIKKEEELIRIYNEIESLKNR
jgi:hypothetical protein